MNIKDIVKDNKATFSHYRAGYLYYNVVVNDVKYSFPIPLDDVGDATMLNEDKAIILMRYIRKSLNDGSFVEVA